VLASVTAPLRSGAPPSAVCVYGEERPDAFWIDHVVVHRAGRARKTLSIQRDRKHDMPLRDRPRVMLDDLNFDG
jgi:hypothetical protein